MENHVAQQVVSAGAVATPTANQRVVTIAIKDSITQRTLEVLLGETDAQPAPKHTHEKSRVVVEPGGLTWAGMQVRARTLSTD